MAVPPSLFIQPIIQRTTSVSMPAVEILSAQAKFSTIESILVSSITSSPIFVSVHISPSNFLVIPPVKIEANSILQLLKESYFSLNTGESLVANSDSSQNLFNINVEGKVFTEVA